MLIRNIGYNHCHDADFNIERPSGSGDCLLLLLKTEAIFRIDGTDIFTPPNTVFIYDKYIPQYYRCVPQSTFSNDWIHFDFEDGEREAFEQYGIPFQTPIPMESLHFLSFCIKSIAHEKYSANRNKIENIRCYFKLMFSKIEEQLCDANPIVCNSNFEMLSTIRNKIYSKPYEHRTITGTAHEVRMSESSFQHLYKKQFGISFVQDLIISRVEYAQLLLSTTDMTVSEVAKQCGYSSYAHFIRQFKAHCNLTPTEYRLQKK